MNMRTIRYDNMKKNNKGFTLAELLIVIAIIGVLVGIAIPVLNSQLEKSRKAKDLHTARSIESVLVTAVNDGTIELAPPTVAGQASGIWVIVTRDKDSWPSDYYGDAKKHNTYFCGANTTVRINGKENDKAWDVYNEEIGKIVSEAGLIGDGLKVVSKNKNNDSWDWYCVEVYYHNGDIKTKIFSGNKNKSSDVTNINEAYNNIGKMIG